MKKRNLRNTVFTKKQIHTFMTNALTGGKHKKKPSDPPENG